MALNQVNTSSGLVSLRYGDSGEVQKEDNGFDGASGKLPSISTESNNLEKYETAGLRAKQAAKIFRPSKNQFQMAPDYPDDTVELNDEEHEELTRTA